MRDGVTYSDKKNDKPRYLVAETYSTVGKKKKTCAVRPLDAGQRRRAISGLGVSATYREVCMPVNKWKTALGRCRDRVHKRSRSCRATYSNQERQLRGYAQKQKTIQSCVYTYK